MTVKLYDENSHLFDFEACVLSCKSTEDGYLVVLDKTAFFPEAGGQDSDRGVLGEARVLDVQISDSIIYHKTNRPLEVGAVIEGHIDADRRIDYMQQHSGEHIVSGVAHRLYGCENVGFHLSDNIVTLDFDKYLDRKQILTIEKQANAVVQKNVRFSAYYPDTETLESISYRSKKELDGDVRIVEIEDTDICACCAPHVNTAGEIGIIKLLDSEKLRGGVRIELKCGMRALHDYNEKYSNTSQIGSLLSLKQNETAEGVQKLSELLTSQKQQLTAIKKRLCNAIIAANENKTVVFEDGLDIKELQLIADGLYRRDSKLHAVFSANGTGYSFCICGEPQEADALFGEFKKQFTVRGGGRNGMLQGSVTDEDKKIKIFFQNN